MRTTGLLLVLFAVAGCSALEGQACTLVGAPEGVGVQLGPELQSLSGSATITVCDGDDCASSEEDWARRPSYGPLPSLTATWEDLGRSFEPGAVDVTVELRDESGTVVAEREQDVKLSPSYPNGKDCDGDGFVHGGMTMTPEDAVRPAS
jgi:hypothetical protein